MRNLLRFEYHKIFRQKSFYVCFGIVFGMIFLNALLMKSLQDGEADVVFRAAEFCESALSSASFSMILGIFTALFVCDDYSNNTLKNIYARGYSREKVYVSKYIASASVSLVMAVLCVAFAFALPIAIGGSEIALDSRLIGNLLAQLVVILGYHALYFAVAMFIGKVGGSVAFNLVGPSLILTALTLITSLLKIETLSFGNYWLDSAMKSLSAGSTDGSLLVRAVVMAAVYIGILIGGGLMLNHKKEI